MSVCRMNECTDTVHGHGYCQRHYYWARENGVLGPLKATYCVVEGCEYKASAYSEGLCTRHLHRAKKARLEEEQLASLVNVLEGKCWICVEAEGSVVDSDSTYKGHDSRSACLACVRGWICTACARTLAAAKDDADTLTRFRYTGTRRSTVYARAIDYLAPGTGSQRMTDLVTSGFFHHTDKFINDGK